MMKNVTTFLFVVLLSYVSFAADAGGPVGDTGREYAETALLLSDKEVDMRFGIKSLHKRDTIKPHSLDLLAEIAWEDCTGKRLIKPDTLAWIAKALGKSRQGRYAPLIEECLGQAIDKSLIKYLTEAKMALADSPRANPFAGGTLNLDKVRADLIRNRKAVPAEPLAKTQLESLKSGQRMDDVYAGLGAPEHISAMSVSRGRAGFMFVKVRLSDDRIVFRYPGLGEARFGYDDATGDWLLADATSEHGLYWLARDGRFVSVSAAITEGDREDLQLIMKSLKRQKEPIESTLLDRIADRIYFSQKENDSDMVNVLAHLCKLLSKSNSGKYRQVMHEVSETAAHKTLRKYAALAADSLPETGERQYSPLKGENL